ncbi:MAG: AtpZ/AtpI family protein [Bacteroidia bacterium]|jgi:F0F1-type ATP synthase assembly protein I
MNKANKSSNNTSRLTGIAMQMMITILVFTLVGYFIDTKINIKFPIGILLGSISGIGIALYRVFKLL